MKWKQLPYKGEWDMPYFAGARQGNWVSESGEVISHGELLHKAAAAGHSVSWIHLFCAEIDLLTSLGPGGATPFKDPLLRTRRRGHRWFDNAHKVPCTTEGHIHAHSREFVSACPECRRQDAAHRRTCLFDDVIGTTLMAEYEYLLVPPLF